MTIYYVPGEGTAGPGVASSCVHMVPFSWGHTTSIPYDNMRRPCEIYFKPCTQEVLILIAKKRVGMHNDLSK
jgi:hypothetical protein